VNVARHRPQQRFRENNPLVIVDGHQPLIKCAMMEHAEGDAVCRIEAGRLVVAPRSNVGCVKKLRSSEIANGTRVLIADQHDLPEERLQSSYTLQALPLRRGLCCEQPSSHIVVSLVETVWSGG
jgi:hypothetical protein